MNGWQDLRSCILSLNLHKHQGNSRIMQYYSTCLIRIGVRIPSYGQTSVWLLIFDSFIRRKGTMCMFMSLNLLKEPNAHEPRGQLQLTANNPNVFFLPCLAFIWDRRWEKAGPTATRFHCFVSGQWEAKKCLCAPAFLTAYENFQPLHVNALSFVLHDGPLLLNYWGVQNENANEQKHRASKLIIQHKTTLGSSVMGPGQSEMQVVIWILWHLQPFTQWITK